MKHLSTSLVLARSEYEAFLRYCSFGTGIASGLTDCVLQVRLLQLQQKHDDWFVSTDTVRLIRQ